MALEFFAQSIDVVKLGLAFPFSHDVSREPRFYSGEFLGVEFENKGYKHLSLKFGFDLCYTGMKDKWSNKEFAEIALSTNGLITLLFAFLSPGRKRYPFADK